MLPGRLIVLGLIARLSASAGDVSLAEAAMRGDREGVRTLLKQKADVNAPQGDGTTALHWAAQQDDLELVRLLLQAGANPNAATRNGSLTPLFLACRNGSATVIEALLAAGVSANSVNAQGTSALMAAAAAGDPTAVKLLLDRGAEVNAREKARGQTALMFAAALNRVAAVQLLLKRGADPLVVTQVTKMERVRVDADGNPLPADATGGRGGRGGAAPAGPDPNAPPAAGGADAAAPEGRGGRGGRAGDVAAFGPREVGANAVGGMTALLLAAREGHRETVAALLDGKAAVNQASEADKSTPLELAIVNGHFDLAKYLLERGADPNLASIAGLTPLYATIDVQWAPHAWYPQPNVAQEKISYLDLMKALLEGGAKPDARLVKKLWFRGLAQDPTWVDPAGSTAFWRAAQSADVVAMRLLATHGADSKLASNQNVTPLMVASGLGWMANHSNNAPNGWLAAVQYCVELGADVNAVDTRGYTALHGAAYIGDNDAVKVLVAKGAKVDAKSKAGDTVADMANGPTRFGLPHPETVALLESLGSANSHNCRSDQCLVAPKEERKPAAAPAKKAN